MNNNFRIIGIRILDGCDQHIHKVLKVNTTYFFCTGYRDDANDFVVKDRDISTLCGMYDIDNLGRKINVVISAIVGKNGDGKSSVIEVMLRVLNNFVVAYGFGKLHNALKSVRSLSACLYYELEGEIYTIKCIPTQQDIITPKQVLWFRDAKSIDNFNGLGQRRMLELIKKHQDELFFSLIINYSLYAYNENTFQRECAGSTSWIQALFHKNDSYQTPINLTPMRTEGNINVNKEKMLAHQRLMSMFTQAGDNAKLSKRKISENEVAIGFACSLADDSNLWRESLDGYFEDNKGTFVTWISLASMGLSSTNVGKSDKYMNREPLDNLLTSVRDFLKWFSNMSSLYKGMLSRLKENAVAYKTDGRSKTDICSHLSTIQNSIRRMYRPNKTDYHTSSGLEKVEIWNSKYLETDVLISNFLRGEYKWLNYTQLFRLYVVWTIWEIITSEEIIPRDSNLNNDLRNAKSDHLAAARLYVAYKLLSIMETYSPYSDERLLFDTDFSLLVYKPESRRNGIASAVKKILEEDDDYTTLKLKQSINYIRHDCLKMDVMENCELKDIEFKKFISFEKLHANIVAITDKEGQELSLHEISQMLPPPFLNGDIIITKDGEYYGLDSLSSGETQRIYTVSSFIYHLRNMDNKQNQKIQYKNICVVFEETEQYFHPDYQRTFVKYLLDQLANAGLIEIENLHIIFATHSPFILSDVTNDNILYLKRGNKDQVDLATFGANVNELLAESFFLSEGFMGEFAKNKICSLVDYLQGVSNRDDWNRSKASALINNIGDEVIKIQLRSMFAKKFEEDKDSYASWLQSECQRMGI